MEQARTVRANNPDADKVLADRIAQCRDKAENAAVAARVKVAAGAADKAKVEVVVVRDAVRTVNAATPTAAIFGNGNQSSNTQNKEGKIMPGFDRSGPLGAGPMTGGRRGMCGGNYNRPGTLGYGRGMGFRRGNGQGRGFGYPAYGGYPAPRAFGPTYPVSSADEMAMLKAEANAMQTSLESIQNRIAELEKDASE